LLMPFVETTTQPTSSANQEAIMQNIQHLHSHLLAEDLAIDDPELQLTYQLFISTLEAGQAAVGSTEDGNLPFLCRRTNDLLTGEDLASPLTADPNYVIRAWIAVAAYLMSDYRFVYE